MRWDSLIWDKRALGVSGEPRLIGGNFEDGFFFLGRFDVVSLWHLLVNFKNDLERLGLAF